MQDQKQCMGVQAHTDKLSENWAIYIHLDHVFLMLALSIAHAT